VRVATAAAAIPIRSAAVASHAMTEEQVNAIYRGLRSNCVSAEACRLRSPNPGTGQSYPGFDLDVPVCLRI
jgi:hypothetical protein